MSRDSVNLATDILTDTRSKNHHASESCPTTHRVDEGRTGEVVETVSTEGGEPAAAPCPATDNRVDEGHVGDGEDEEGVELHTFSNGTRHDRCGGCCKHCLEQPVCEQRKVSVVGCGEVCRICPVANAEACETENSVESTRVHKAKAEQGVHRDTDCRHCDIFESDVCRALSTHEACFDTCKSETHDEHQHGADHDPNVFRHKDGVVDGCDCCYFVHLYKSFLKILVSNSEFLIPN